MKIDIGISENDRKQLAAGLSKLLADSYTLYVKTHNFHWNVTGNQFQTLHVMFENQYKELALAVDDIAERIRALGHPAPGSFAQFNALTEINESTTVPTAAEMLVELVHDHETVIRRAREIFPLVEKTHDDPTADLLTQRMATHEKTAWMLRSMLE
jgi:starvation-inducible DNA-binding protein